MINILKQTLILSTLSAVGISVSAHGTAPIHANPQDQQVAIVSEVFSKRDILKFQSTMLGEERSLWIYKPDGYAENKDKNYPVIYFLDGSRHFDHGIAAMKYLSSQRRIPESIIVAIPNLPGTRRRDMLDKSENFTQFIKSEVLPHIESNYRTNENKSLFGHSLAGRFTLLFMSEHKNIFTNYIAASPAMRGNDFRAVKMLEKNLKTKDEGMPIVYFSVGLAEQTGFIESVDAFQKLLKTDVAPDLKWTAEYLPNLEHMTSPYVATFKGLQFVFSDYSDLIFSSVTEYETAGGMQAIEAHYKKREQKYGLENKISQRSLISLANLYAREENHEKAVEIFEYNGHLYPESLQANFMLARGYYAAGMNEKSIEYFQKSLAIDAKTGNSNKARIQRMLQQAEAKAK